MGSGYPTWRDHDLANRVVKSEFVYFEWTGVDAETYETITKGSVYGVRRGHSDRCYLKSEQLTFYRHVFASREP